MMDVGGRKKPGYCNFCKEVKSDKSENRGKYQLRFRQFLIVLQNFRLTNDVLA